LLEGVTAALGREIDQREARGVPGAVGVPAGGTEFPATGFGAADHGGERSRVSWFDPTADQPVFQLLPGEPRLPAVGRLRQQFRGHRHRRTRPSGSIRELAGDCAAQLGGRIGAYSR
jgi:hypothetical protein